MYFKEKEDTNIDKEFSNNKNISIDFKKLKPIMFIVVGIVLLIVLILIIISLFNNSNKNRIILEGEQNIIISLGSDYIEPGYTAYDKNGNDITNQVKITSDLDITKEGSYEIIYSVSNISKVRYVTISKINQDTLIHLTKGKTIYLEKGEKYTEPGYTVYDTLGEDLNDKVKITGTVDTSKIGTYQITYSVTNSRNITTTVKRTIIVVEKGQKPKF